MQYYRGVVYLRDGSYRTTGSSNDRMQAERMAIQLFDQLMRCAISDYFKPTRYEVVAV